MHKVIPKIPSKSYEFDLLGAVFPSRYLFSNIIANVFVSLSDDIFDSK